MESSTESRPPTAKLRALAEDDIWHAARRGDAAAIEGFIQAGVSVAALDECGKTPGYYASLYGHSGLGALLKDFEARETSTPAGARPPPEVMAAAAAALAKVQAANSRPPTVPLPPRPPLATSASQSPPPSTAPGSETMRRPRVQDPARVLRQKRLAKLVFKQMIEDQSMHRDKWLKNHDSKAPFEFSREQRRELKRWFDFIDADGSGEINVEELEDPLISTGIARNTAELQRLIDMVDTDGSGEIGFEEFLAVLKPRTNGSLGGNAASAFMQLQQQLSEQKGLLPLQLLVTMHRRKFLLETIVGNPEAEEKERREMRRAEDEFDRTKNAHILAHLKRRQRQRDAVKGERAERLGALQAVVDRQKKREAVASQAKLVASSSQADAATALAQAEAAAGISSPPQAARPASPTPAPGPEEDRLALLRSQSGLSSGAGSRTHSSSASRLKQSGNTIVHGQSRQLNTGTGMQYAPKRTDKPDLREQAPRFSRLDGDFGAAPDMY